MRKQTEKLRLIPWIEDNDPFDRDLWVLWQGAFVALVWMTTRQMRRRPKSPVTRHPLP